MNLLTNQNTMADIIPDKSGLRNQDPTENEIQRRRGRKKVITWIVYEHSFMQIESIIVRLASGLGF